MPFSSQEFREFAASNKCEVITSSPGYPQSNGMVENDIKTAKSIMMKKAKQAGTDIYFSLLDWRNTPSEGISSSPAQKMFGRRTRTLLPTTRYLLKPRRNFSSRSPNKPSITIKTPRSSRHCRQEKLSE